MIHLQVEKVWCGLLTLVDEVLLPSISLLECNSSLAEELWAMMCRFPYELRWVKPCTIPSLIGVLSPLFHLKLLCKTKERNFFRKQSSNINAFHIICYTVLPWISAHLKAIISSKPPSFPFSHFLNSRDTRKTSFCGHFIFNSLGFDHSTVSKGKYFLLSQVTCGYFYIHVHDAEFHYLLSLFF